jgi:hypothetical protein
VKVKDLIEQLKAYDGEDELIVAYWDKETVEGYGAPKMSDEDWSYVIEQYEDGEWHFQSSAAEDFVEIAQRVMAEADEDEG